MRIDGSLPLSGGEQLAEMLANMRREIAELQRSPGGGSARLARRRNMIDNANGGIAQRGNVRSATSGDLNGYWTADRWRISNAVGATTPTLGVSTLDVVTPDGLDTAIRIACDANAKPSLAAGDYVILSQGVEGHTLRAVQALDGYYTLKPTTCSFWVHPTYAGTFIVEFLVYSAAGANIYNVSRAVTLTANVWQRVTLAVPGLSTGATQIHSLQNTAAQLYFWLAAGTAYTSGPLSTAWAAPVNANRAAGQSNLVAANGQAFHVTNVQWEVGPATPYERLTLDEDLRRCRRYFQRWSQPPLRGVVATSPTASRMGMALPVPMRVPPVPTLSGTLRMFDGSTDNTVAALGSGNYSQTGDAVEVDMTATLAWTVTGRQAVLYQSPTTGWLDLYADL